MVELLTSQVWSVWYQLGPFGDAAAEVNEIFKPSVFATAALAGYNHWQRTFNLSETAPVERTDLLRRVAQLEERLARIESLLGSSPPVPAEPSPAAAADESSQATPAASAKHMPPDLHDDAQTKAAALAAKLQDEVRAIKEGVVPVEELPAEVIPVDDEETGEEPPRRFEMAADEPVSRGSLEQTIGLKWAAWIGAIVLVIGAGLGIKFAYDEGWLLHMSPTTRLALLSVGGFALLALGEWIYRRVNEISASGPFGAGVGILFLVSYSGHLYYQVYDYNTAFIFVSLVTLIGAGVAMRAKLVSIAVISLIGGYLGPWLLSSNQRPDVPFYAYLYMLEVVGVVLAFWGNSPKWWILRGLSFAATAFWVAAVFVAEGPAADWADPRLWFFVLYAFTYQFELIATAWRVQATSPESGESLQAAEQTGGTLFSLLVTAGITIITLLLVRHWDPAIRSAWVLAFAGFCAAAGLPFKDAIHPRMRALAISFLIQATALLVVAVPVGLSNLWVNLAWGVMALAFAAQGAVFRRDAGRVCGIITWLLAILHLAATTAEAGANPPQMGVLDPPQMAVWLTILGEDIRAWTVIAWLLALAGQGLAWLVQAEIGRPDRPISAARRQAGILVSVVASIVWIITSLAGLPPLGATFALAVWAWLLAGLDFYVQGIRYAVHALAVLFFASVKWAIVDTLAHRLQPSWNALEYRPVFNPMMGVGLLLAASLGTIAWLRRPSLRRDMEEAATKPFGGNLGLVALMGLAVAVATLGLTFEIDRLVERAAALKHNVVWPPNQLKLLGMTMLWSAGVLLFAWIGRRAKEGMVLPWFLMAILVMKFFTVDTLFWRPGGIVPVRVIGNIQVLTALVLLASIALLARLSPAVGLSAKDGPQFATVMAWLAAAIVVWAGMLEIERAIQQLVTRDFDLVWSTAHFTQMAWTIWWVVAAIGFLAAWRRWGKAGSTAASSAAGWFVLALIALKFLIVDTLGFRLAEQRPADVLVVLNFQVLTAAIIVAGMAAWRFLSARPGLKPEPALGTEQAANFLAVLMGLFVGTLEIDRAFSGKLATGLSDPYLAKQAIISVFWSLYAVAVVAGGFYGRAAWLRYFGLGLFAVTLFKVGIFDLSQVKYGYRILSSMGLGLLLLGTSVLYGKLSPKLLADERPAGG